MRIVVLDGHTLDRGDLGWAPFEALGACTIHARTPPELVIERAAGAEIVLINKTPLTRAVFEALPALRYVGVLATGYDVVDVAAAEERGIVVTNVPSYGTESVAQATFALLLALTNHVETHAKASCEGRWRVSGDFSYVEEPLVELHGRTLGIVGLGRIGLAVARIGHAFGMRLLGHGGRRAPASDLPIELVSLDDIFERADVVTLHCPLTPESAKLVDARRLACMKPGAFLLNTARGGLVDERALAEALALGRLGGAGLDVLSVEPPPAEHPLLHAPRCLVTPHQAWATQASRARLLALAVENLRAFLAGAPRNVVRAA